LQAVTTVMPAGGEEISALAGTGMTQTFTEIN
jgi:hypothetical protein